MTGSAFARSAAFAALFVSLSAMAAGDYPLASCKSWNGTVIERDGINTANATMKGIVTKADIQEYCERDPGGVTKQHGGRLTVRECVAQEQRGVGSVRLASRANCFSGVMTFGSETVKFPLVPGRDTSCASGMPPLLEQFKLLCPNAAQRLDLEGFRK